MALRRASCGKGAILALSAALAGALAAGCVGREERPPDWRRYGEASVETAAEDTAAAEPVAGDAIDPGEAARGRTRDTVYFYMSPRGNDAGPGSRERPVATLAGVHSLLEQRSPDADVVVKVRSDAGTYVNQTVLWTYYRPEYSITIEADPAKYNACFAAGADPPASPFFGLNASRGERTNIILRGLTVRDYISRAVLFLGDREIRDNWNGGNVVERCTFERIGNAREPSRAIVYSAIGLVNSRNNRIVGCSFIDIKNHTIANFPQKGDSSAYQSSPDIWEADKRARAMGPGTNPNIPIVCIYLAHYSDSNVIDSCEFERVKGDAVRIRDASNDNVIANNRFERVGWNAIVSTWHCDAPRQNCAKEFGLETASTGNAIVGNRAAGNWRGGMPRIYFDMRPPEGTADASVPRSSAFMRIEGNTLEAYRGRRSAMRVDTRPATSYNFVDRMSDNGIGG